MFKTQQMKDEMNNNDRFDLHYISLYQVPIGLLQDIQKELEPYVGSIFAIQVYDTGDYAYQPLTLSEQFEHKVVNVKITVELQSIIHADVIMDFLRQKVDKYRDIINNLNTILEEQTNNG